MPSQNYNVGNGLTRVDTIDPERLVDLVIGNLLCRAGFDHWWYTIEGDIRLELYEDLVREVRDYIS